MIGQGATKGFILVVGRRVIEVRGESVPCALSIADADPFEQVSKVSSSRVDKAEAGHSVVFVDAGLGS